MQAQSLSNSMPFMGFLFKDKRNRTILWVTLGLIITEFCLFKYFYPYASYIHGDSFSYIKAAHENLNVSTYLIGYSKFLRLFSVFSNSDTILVLFQYTLLQFSTLYFLFSIFYIYRTNNKLQYPILFLVIFNPLYLHLANLISSDCLFLSVSIFWLTTLIWTLYKPSKTVIILHIILLLLALTIRYNALIYPLISLIFIMKSSYNIKQKFIILSTVVITCSLFVSFTAYQYKQITGRWQFSPFSGWQWANNAMYTYRYIKPADRKKVPEKYFTIDNYVRKYIDSSHNYLQYPQLLVKASTVYMWTKTSPLYTYENSLYLNDTSATDFKKWASMGPFYGEYGRFIIKTYLPEHLKYYIWPNANRYFSPPVEFLEYYNSGKDTVNKETMNWFDYRSNKVNLRHMDNKVSILNVYPIMAGAFNLVFILLFMIILLSKSIISKVDKRLIFLPILYWILNATFTILSSSAALRFQSFAVIVTMTFSFIFLDIILTNVASTTLKPNKIVKGQYAIDV